MRDFVEKELAMSKDTYTHHFPTIGIYGRLPGVELQTSLHSTLWDQGCNVIFFGPASKINRDWEQDAVIIMSTDGAEDLMKDAESINLTGVTLCNPGYDKVWTVIDLQGAEVYGSGNNVITTMIRNAVCTGQIYLRGLPEDEYALIEQEDLAQTIVLALYEHLNSGSQGLIPAWGVRSKPVTLGEFSRALFKGIQEYRNYREETSRGDIAPVISVPQISKTSRGNSFGHPNQYQVRDGNKRIISRTELPEDPDAIKLVGELKPTPAKYFNGYSDLYHGIKATIFRLVQEEDNIVQIPREARYALPREILLEMTHNPIYSPKGAHTEFDRKSRENAYLLDMEF